MLLRISPTDRAVSTWGVLSNRIERCRAVVRRNRRVLPQAAVVCLLALLVATQICAANPLDERRKAASKFKKGDKVETKFFDDKEEGVVQEVDNFGRVKVVTPKHPNGWPFQPNQVRLLSRKAGAKPKAKAAAAGNDESNPFASDEEKFQEIGKRTWTDRSGKFRIEATVVRVDGEKVVLKRADNKEISVDRTKLSDDDQKVLNQVAGGAPAAEESADETPADPEAPAGPEIELTETDLASATPVDISAAGAWKYQPDPDAAPQKLSRVALPKLDFFDRVEAILMPAGSTAYVVVANQHNQQAATRIFACDLEKRKLASQGDFYANQLPLDVSPDGKKLLSRSKEFGLGKNGTLFLYSLEGSIAKPVASWNPYGKSRGNIGNVEWARFVDNDHLLTLSSDGQLALWDTSGEVRPVYSAQARRGARAVFSGNRKYLLVRAESGIAILNPMSGESAGFIEAPGGWQSALALRPDGKKLAVTDFGRVRVWNLESRELERDFSLAGGLNAASIAWCDDDRLITGTGDLVDVERRLLLWRYTGCDSPVVNGGEGVWAVVGKSGDNTPVLAGVKLPHGDVVRAAEKLDPDALLVIKPGLEVSLKTSFSGTAEQQERVKAALTKRLEEAGMKIVPQSPITLTATIKAGKSTKVQYRSFGSFTTSEHNVPQQILELAYQINGKPVWTYVSQSWVPHSLHLEQGETIDQALARETKQNPEQFESIFVPAYVAAAPPGGPGTSPWPGS